LWNFVNRVVLTVCGVAVCAEVEDGSVSTCGEKLCVVCVCVRRRRVTRVWRLEVEG
jgi:hypothetical protein